ncbi:hypothetical protein [Leptolyngbya sp. FACHB-261]|uniref:hypothetical protein n=1 Tax=Leptolyngbya sp. FACHB-261 TaxID=2692806 RepID=UPI0016828478|nr:hypothetical protein [Leptolyngbya sp. FACHB-261]MBD2103450.1 hypothetical protein [Leptolyngbya sp. FACHB-261]
MLEGKISPIDSVSEAGADHLIFATEAGDYTIDCYPYAVRGTLVAALLSVSFWTSVSAVLWLVL